MSSRVLAVLAIVGIGALIWGYASPVFCAIPDDANEMSNQDESVFVANTAVAMPLNKFLLVRKGSEYCVLRFTEMWLAETKEDSYKGKRVQAYSRYEAYFQGDGTGNFSSGTVLHREDELIRPWVRGFHPFVWNDGPKKTAIRCGPISLLWGAGGSVHFFPSNIMNNPAAIIKLGIELAPTPWTDISQVNIADPRIRWYRYDVHRPDIRITLDQLWPEK